MARQALHGLEAALDPQNIYTISCIATCGATSRLIGDLKEAENLLRQALRGLERTMGMDHSFTLHCVFDLAMSLRDQGSYDEAAALFRRACDGSAATRGSGHTHSVHWFRVFAGLRSFFQERAALQEAFEESESETLSDSGWDVAEIYGRNWGCAE